ILPAHIPVFSYQTVVFIIFTKLPDTRRDDYQLAAVLYGHPGPVNGLVAQPGALELLFVEIDDHFFQRLVHKNDIFLLTEGYSLFKNPATVARKQAVDGYFVICLCRYG